MYNEPFQDISPVEMDTESTHYVIEHKEKRLRKTVSFSTPLDDSMRSDSPRSNPVHSAPERQRKLISVLKTSKSEPSDVGRTTSRRSHRTSSARRKILDELYLDTVSNPIEDGELYCDQCDDTDKHSSIKKSTIDHRMKTEQPYADNETEEKFRYNSDSVLNRDATAKPKRGEILTSPEKSPDRSELEITCHLNRSNHVIIAIKKIFSLSNLIEL